MKTTKVAISAGATPTEIPATIPAKFAKVVEDSAAPVETLLVQMRQPDHSFSVEVIFMPGVPIRLQGYSGIIARPAGYSAYLIPASNEAMCKIRTVSGNATNMRVQEYEQEPWGED